MAEFPHHYNVTSRATPEGNVSVEAEGLTALTTAAPREFGGPGDQWSPETLLVAAVADCFVLSFRAVAQASNVEWQTLRCRVRGTLDRVERTMQFTAFTVQATLEIPDESRADAGRRALEKAEKACLVSNSLNAEVHLEPEVTGTG